MSGRVAGAFFLGLLVCTRGAALATSASEATTAPSSAAPELWLGQDGASAARSWLPRDWVGRPPASRPQRAWERRKSGRVALVSSLVVPGLGQLYNEREFWALVAAGVESYFIGNIVVEQRLANRHRALANDDEILMRRCEADSIPDCSAERQQFDLDQALFVLHRDNRIQSTWLLGLAMLLSGLQAFVDAHLFDFDTSPPPQVRFEAVGLDGRPGAALRLHF